MKTFLKINDEVGTCSAKKRLNNFSIVGTSGEIAKAGFGAVIAMPSICAIYAPCRVCGSINLSEGHVK